MFVYFVDQSCKGKTSMKSYRKMFLWQIGHGLTLENKTFFFSMWFKNWIIMAWIPSLTWKMKMWLLKNVPYCLGVLKTFKWNPLVWSKQTRWHWKKYIGRFLGQAPSLIMKCLHGLYVATLPKLKVVQLNG